MKVLTKVLVGSRLHGLDTPTSDYDYRGIHINDLKEVLSPFRTLKNTTWIEGDEDNTSYELADFCKNAVHGNATILEVFFSDQVIETSTVANDMRANWQKFFDAMVDDTPNEWCQKLLHALIVDGHKVVFISGRPDSHRNQTELWLSEHYPKAFTGELYMRPAGNYDPDYKIKEEILAAHFDDDDQANILFVVDDRKQVVDMWRRHGLTVLQCDEGDF